MNKKYSIEDLKLVYDRDNKKFTKAYVTIDGVQQILTDNEIIRNVMKEAATERGVDDIRLCPNDYSLAFVDNEKAIASFEKKYSDVKTDDNSDVIVPPMVLKKENEFDGKEVKEFDKYHDLKRGVIGGVIVTAAAALASAGILAASKGLDAGAKEANQIVQDKEITKENPESWEKYVSEYSVSKQKTLLTGIMSQITGSIVDITVNDKEYKVALTPEEMIALEYYYNTYEITNEDMLSKFGLYSLQGGKDSNLTSNVHNALSKIMISLYMAETKEDVLQFELADEESKKLWDKYVDLAIEYKNSKSPKKVKAKVEDEFRNDYLGNGSIDINEHPSATFILQIVPFIFEMNNDNLNSNLYKSLLGVENNNVNNKVTMQQNGLVDASCSYIDERLEEFDDYRQTIQNDHRIDSRLNRDLLLEVNEDLKDDKGQVYYDERYVQSDFSRLTKDTYDLKTVMIPIMNDYLVKNYDLDEIVDFEEFNSELMKDIISAMQKTQLNNTKPWDLKNNPSGGKVGDVLKGETKTGVKVTESQLTEQQVNDAKKEYLEKHPDVLENEEEFKKQVQEDTATASAAWDKGYAETKVAGENAPLTSEYANHKDEVIRNAYYMGRNDGINYYNQKKAAEEKKNQTQVDPSLGTDAGEHKDNPNQGGDRKDPVDTPVEEEVNTNTGEQENTSPEPETPSEEVVTPPAQEETKDEPSHEDNPNQNGEQDPVEDEPIEEEIDTTHVIEGTITTDPTGVEDMSEYGEVQEASAYTISTDEMVDYIDSLVEEMANPENPINAVEEASVELVK